MNFSDLRKIDVKEYIEKKNNLSYLSWAYAVDQLLQNDPTAVWEYRFFEYPDFGAVPYCKIGDSCMVFCTVNAFGVKRTAHLPVMDHRNKAISNPDSFQVNTAMQRCLAKAISLHGIGLYIYAGEDIPDRVEQEKSNKDEIKKEIETKIKALTTEKEVREFFKTANTKLCALPNTPDHVWLTDQCKARLSEIKPAANEAKAA